MSAKRYGYRHQKRHKRLKEEARLRPPKLLVVCFHCGKNIPKNEAFYIKEYDTYLCEKHYLDLLEGKPIRLSNWKRRGV